MGCSREACARKHYARGLCVTHYRAARRAAGIDAMHGRREYARACDCCGLRFVTTYREQRYCDRTCRAIANLLSGQNSAASALGVRARNDATTCAIAYRTCLYCGALLVTHDGIGSPKLYCKPSHRAAYRSREKGNAHRAHALTVYERDGYTCWLCGEQTSATYSHDDPQSPTLDHLIPRSLGGTDDPDNLGTAHAICNSLRGAQLVSELLAA